MTIHVGRRKSSVARARITSGSGQFSINGRELEDYFPTEKMRNAVLQPFETVEQVGVWDVRRRSTAAAPPASPTR